MMDSCSIAMTAKNLKLSRRKPTPQHQIALVRSGGMCSLLEPFIGGAARVDQRGARRGAAQAAVRALQPGRARAAAHAPPEAADGPPRDTQPLQSVARPLTANTITRHAVSFWMKSFLFFFHLQVIRLEYSLPCGFKYITVPSYQSAPVLVNSNNED